MDQKKFEPVIVGILCNWCSYQGADLAGTSRRKYPANVRVVRVMCSGRVEPSFILKALASGADGVLVCGCHPGDCHYQDGNYKALRRHTLLKTFLSQMGIEDDRVRLEWISASEGDRFAKVVADMTEKVRKLGPLGKVNSKLSKLTSEVQQEERKPIDEKTKASAVLGGQLRRM